MLPLNPVTRAEAIQARLRLQGTVMHTPLVPFQPARGDKQIFLKLENLQPTGSFKLRAAGNALLAEPQCLLPAGVWTASAGNMALGLAWLARWLDIPCTAVLPDNAPAVKVQALQALQAHIVQVPFDEYQQIQQTGCNPGLPGRLVHPFADPLVLAGNATLALEILEDLPDVDLILVPYGGGGLSCAIASILKQLHPQTKIFAVEVESAAPLTASLAAGRPVTVPFTPSFVSGMGAPFVFERMWPLASTLLDGSMVVTLDEVRSSIRLLALQNKILAEPAGAVALAAALRCTTKYRQIAAIVSGGNIDPLLLTSILEKESPSHVL